ncbi:hypothetical protein ACFL2T_01960 [Elusimicrobiota bacterium]
MAADDNVFDGNWENAYRLGIEIRSARESLRKLNAGRAEVRKLLSETQEQRAEELRRLKEQVSSLETKLSEKETQAKRELAAKEGELGAQLEELRKSAGQELAEIQERLRARERSLEASEGERTERADEAAGRIGALQRKLEAAMVAVAESRVAGRKKLEEAETRIRNYVDETLTAKVAAAEREADLLKREQLLEGEKERLMRQIEGNRTEAARKLEAEKTLWMAKFAALQAELRRVSKE